LSVNTKSEQLEGQAIMFSRPSEEHPSSATDATVAAQQKSQVRSAAISTIISSDLTVIGNLTSIGEIQVDGRVEGDIRCATLSVGDQASVHGKIITEQVTVRGRVQGTIRARKVLLAASCHVEGDLLYETFAVEPGGHLVGNCRRSENPLIDDCVVSEAAIAITELHPAAVNSSRHYSALAHEPVTVLAKLPPLGDANDLSATEAQQDN
jgi:cytoskeletal protein CcmA (bactofilin family)